MAGDRIDHEVVAGFKLLAGSVGDRGALALLQAISRHVSVVGVRHRSDTAFRSPAGPSGASDYSAAKLKPRCSEGFILMSQVIGGPIGTGDANGHP